VGPHRQRLALLGAEGRLGIPAFWTITLFVQALLGDGAYALRFGAAARQNRCRLPDRTSASSQPGSRP